MNHTTKPPIHPSARPNRITKPNSMFALIVAVGMILGLAPTSASNASEIPHSEPHVEGDIVTRVEAVPGLALQGVSVPIANPYRDNAWVAYYSVTKAPSGTHTWEVWSCNDPTYGPPTLTPTQFINEYGTQATAWFSQVSGGSYQPQFVAKGSFTPETLYCTWDAPEPAGDRGVVMIRGGCCGIGGPGGLLIRGGTTLELIDGTRTAEIGTGNSDAILDTLVHEMGHGLGWPHVPADLDGGGTTLDYNNLADVMSGSQAVGGAVAPTATFNLYTSGWLNPSDLVVWEQGTASFRLRTPKASGPKLLAVPSGVQGRFHTVSVTPTSVSSASPRGIMVHNIDQTPVEEDGYCSTDACFLVTRITEALVVPGTPTDLADRVDPILEVGDSLTVGTWKVRVVTAHADGYTVELTGKGGKAPAAPPRFEDVPSDHTFVDAIEKLADAGITKGCNPSQGNTRFCPDDPVTRGQMAAFLVRALNLPGYTGPDRFRDDNGHTFESNIEALAQAGVTRGCNPSQGNTRFCPDDNVTRGQMAAFLVRALNLPTYTGPDPFTDDNGDTFETAIESLAQAGITKGCNPGQGNTRFCPDDPVTRGQMAAFLVRAGLTD